MLFVSDIHDIADLQDEHQDDWAESWECRYTESAETGKRRHWAPYSNQGWMAVSAAIKMTALKPMVCQMLEPIKRVRNHLPGER